MTKSNQEVLDDYKGSILGAAVGDALGAGYEFTKPDDAQIIEMIGGGVFDWKPGEWTDDTQMSLAILFSLANGKSSTESIAQCFLDWYNSNPSDIGNQTRSVLSSTENATEMLTIATAFMDANPKAAGNGALMRTSPVALMALNDKEKLKSHAAEIAALTHAHVDSVNACILWTLAINDAIYSQSDAQSFDWVNTVRDGIDYIESDQRDRWNGLIDEAQSKDPNTFTPNGWVVSAFQAALSVISHTEIPKANPSEHFRNALINAVKIGDDTDTVASIAGAYLGSKWGKGAIPMEWIEKINGFRLVNSDPLTHNEVEKMIEAVLIPSYSAEVT